MAVLRVEWQARSRRPRVASSRRELALSKRAGRARVCEDAASSAIEFGGRARLERRFSASTSAASVSAADRAIVLLDVLLVGGRHVAGAFEQHARRVAVAERAAQSEFKVFKSFDCLAAKIRARAGVFERLRIGQLAQDSIALSSSFVGTPCFARSRRSASASARRCCASRLNCCASSGERRAPVAPRVATRRTAGVRIAAADCWAAARLVVLALALALALTLLALLPWPCWPCWPWPC